jgi:hypothetical protein
LGLAVPGENTNNGWNVHAETKGLFTDIVVLED